MAQVYDAVSGPASYRHDLRRLLATHWSALAPFADWDAGLARLALEALDDVFERYLAELDHLGDDAASHAVARDLLRHVLTERAAARRVEPPALAGLEDIEVPPDRLVAVWPAGRGRGGEGSWDD